MTLVRVYCGLASADNAAVAPDTGLDTQVWLTVSIVDDAGRLLDICEVSDDAGGYAELCALFAQRGGGPGGVAVATENDEHIVTQLLTAAGRYLAYTDEDSADDYAERFADDDSPDEIRSGPAERRAIGLARALQAGVLSAVPQATPRDMIAIKPLLSAHAAMVTGRQQAASTLREVLRELYPAALRAYADPAERVSLAVLEALPEAGQLGITATGGRARETQVVDALVEAGVAEQTTLVEAVTALRVAVAETPRRTGVTRAITSAVAETVRQAVSAVQCCDAATEAMVRIIADRMTTPKPVPMRPSALAPAVNRQPLSAPLAPATSGPLRVVAGAGNGAGAAGAERVDEETRPAVPAARRARAEDEAAAMVPVPLPPRPVEPSVRHAESAFRSGVRLSRPPAQAPALPAASLPAAPLPAAPLPAAPPPAASLPAAPLPAAPPPAVSPATDTPDSRPAVAASAPAAHMSEPMPYIPVPLPYSAPVVSAPPAPSYPGIGHTTSTGPQPQLPAAVGRRAAPDPVAPASPPVIPPQVIPPPAPSPLPMRTSQVSPPGQLGQPAAVHATPSGQFGQITYPAVPTPPVPRLSPEVPAPGSRSSWPVVGDPSESGGNGAFGGGSNGGNGSGALGNGVSSPVPFGGGAADLPRPIDLPRQREGRVTPPWQADDLPNEPPTLRLVEPAPLADPALSIDRPPADDVIGADLRFDPPTLRLVGPERPEHSEWQEHEDRTSRRSRRAVEELGEPPVQSSGDDSDLLIFAACRSAWFIDGNEADDEVSWSFVADSGWEAAEQASRPAVGTETTAGLPRRVPQQNLVPGSPPPVADERPLRIVRDAASIAAHTSGYFSGYRRGQEVGGYAVGGRPGRESVGGWDFSRETAGDDEDYLPSGEYEYRSARR